MSADERDHSEEAANQAAMTEEQRVEAACQLPEGGKITLAVEFDAVEFWSAALGSGWETWSWWYVVDYQGGDWDKPCLVNVMVSDPEGDDESETVCKSFTLDDLVKAYGVLVGKGHRLNPEDMDACDGDALIQQAIFGEVVYG